MGQICHWWLVLKQWKNWDSEKETAHVRSPYWFTHLAAFGVSHILSPTLYLFTSFICFCPVISCSCLFHPLFLFPGINHWVNWINLLSSVFPLSILLSSCYHLTQLFPICPGLPCHVFCPELNSQAGWRTPTGWKWNFQAVFGFFTKFLTHNRIPPSACHFTFSWS